MKKETFEETVSKIRQLVLEVLIEQEKDQEIKVGNYQTRYYYVCPGATTLYQDIEDKVEDMDLAERTAKLQDALFFIEKHVEEPGYEGDPFYADVAEILANQIMAMARMMGLEKEHGYIQGHVDRVKKAVA